MTENTTTETITLPAAGSLNQLWDTLGFPELTGQPVPTRPGATYGPGVRKIQGVYRRLAAGMRSILTRGFAAGDLWLGRPDSSDQRWLGWSSESGAWDGSRTWRVSGQIRLTADGISATNVVVEVKSKKEDEWTAFTGGPLNVVIGARLGWVVAIIGARLTEASSPLTIDEFEEGYHDIHGGPVKAWATDDSHVVLVDDPNGCGYLRTTGACKPLLAELRQAGWDHLTTR